MGSISVTLEMELSGFQNGWTDATRDLADEPITVKYGMNGSSVSDRVASTGTLSFSLNNSRTNSAGSVGYYSQGHPSCRPGFNPGIRVRFSIVTAAGRFYKHVGTLDDALPVAGVWEAQVTRCTSVDFIDDMARCLLTGIPVQLGRRSDQVFSTIVAAMPRQPNAVEIDVGLDTYPYSLDNVDDTATRALQAVNDLAMSELGFVYVKGDQDQGGTLVFESRSRRPLTGSTVDTFTDAQLVGLVASRSRGSAINKVQVTSHPRRIGTTTDVLFDLKTRSLVQGGQTVTLLGPYRDPLNSGNRAGGFNMVAPVAATDYTMNSAVDAGGAGVGADLTTGFTVVANFGGNGVRWSITNNGAVAGYITKLQCRGQGIFDTAPAVAEASDAASVIQNGQNAVNVDMKFQNDPLVALEASQYLVTLYKNPLTQVQKVSMFAPATDQAFISRILRREISDRIALQEAVTGIAASTGYFINGVELTIEARNHVHVSFVLAPADSTKYWTLGVAGASELDMTTVLGYGLITGHTDVAHIDVHGDVAHSDVAHSDVAHSDVAHTDAGHGDNAHPDVAHADAHTDVAHADVVHADVAHADQAHSDSHGDQAAVSAHADVAHNDGTLSHSDVAHNDAAHADVAHSDSYRDISDGGPHADLHVDVAHQDSHADVAHADSAVHGDDAHQDTHSDVAHSDFHNDTVHSDVAHSDVAAQSVAHSDVAHSDVAHSDVAAQNVAHQDSAHVDVAHSDSHADAAHSDSHSDTPHGDH